MYGSNLHLPRLQERAPEWDGRFQLGQLPHYELRFHKRSCHYRVAASIAPHTTRSVWGIVIELNSRDLNRMDRYESLHLIPKQYDRHTVTIRLSNRVERVVQTYIAEPEFVVEGLLPTSDYLNYLLQGGRYCGLPLDYLQAIARLGGGGHADLSLASGR